MNKQIEHAVFKGRETSGTEPAPMRKIDFEVGDYVQIRATAPHHKGAIGVIIGVNYREIRKRPVLSYTVKFSGNDSAAFIAEHFSFIRSAEHGEI